MDLSGNYVKMNSKKSSSDEYVKHIPPILADTDRSSCQINEPESSEHTNDLQEGLIYNSR